jgi:glyoxylase-like metal-dependent hydrolase (beta-lactamase superfamily II)
VALMAAFRSDDTIRQPWVMAEPDLLLEDGDPVPLAGRQLRVIWTPGHTPGHLCVRELDARLLLTGDHVLPRITPNVGLHPASDGPVLADFVGSLAKVGEYDDHDALPAHEYRFRGLRARTLQLQAHHERRCQEIAEVVAELGDPTLWQLAERLTWSRPWAEIGPMRFAAIAETTAHVRHLVDTGDLTWSRPLQDGDETPLRLRSPA